MAILREDIYNAETRGIQTENTTIFKVNSPNDVKYAIWRKEYRGNQAISQNSDGSKNGARSRAKTTSIDDRFSLKDIVGHEFT